MKLCDYCLTTFWSKFTLSAIRCPSFPWQHIKCHPVSCRYTALCLAQEEPSSSAPPPVAVTTAPHAAFPVFPQLALSLESMSLRSRGPARHRGNNGRTHPRQPTPTLAQQHVLQGSTLSAVSLYLEICLFEEDKTDIHICYCDFLTLYFFESLLLIFNVVYIFS